MSINERFNGIEALSIPGEMSATVEGPGPHYMFLDIAMNHRDGKCTLDIGEARLLHAWLTLALPRDGDESGKAKSENDGR